MTKKAENSNFAWVLRNGEWTLKELSSGQDMHSKIGPTNEAIGIYVRAFLNYTPQIFSEKNSITVWDVGMGLAANVIALLNTLSQNENLTFSTLEIQSFELHPEGLLIALQKENFVYTGFSDYKNQMTELLHNGGVTWNLQCKGKSIQIIWKLFSGSFFEHASQAQKPDYIFYDFYAPQIFPELWGYHAFFKILPHLQKEALLITYASSTAARSAMLLNGFWLLEGASTEAKSQTTLAFIRPSQKTQEYLFNSNKRLLPTWLNKLEKSSKPFPIDIPYSVIEAKTIIQLHPQFSKQ